jgi:hypothetical protein
MLGLSLPIGSQRLQVLSEPELTEVRVFNLRTEDERVIYGVPPVVATQSPYQAERRAELSSRPGPVQRPSQS